MILGLVTMRTVPRRRLSGRPSSLVATVVDSQFA
jgi:hypothetical protein